MQKQKGLVSELAFFNEHTFSELVGGEVLRVAFG
jgi:hypothetical protein